MFNNLKKEFKLTTILYNSKKRINLLGTFNNKQIILIIEKLNFDKNEIDKVIRNIDLKKLLCKNDIYYKYIFDSLQENSITIIEDVTLEIIEKYKKKQYKIMKESYQFYQNNFKKKIEKDFDKNTLWIQNILNKKEEQNNILYQDKNFVLLPDIKWDQKNMNDLYYLAILNKYDNKFVTNIRDLTYDHIGLLEDLLVKSKKEIFSKHGIRDDKLLAYVHYHPSYYIFHVHFTLISNDNFIDSNFRNIFLSEIIQNLKIKKDYYQNIDIDVLVEK